MIFKELVGQGPTWVGHNGDRPAQRFMGAGPYRLVFGPGEVSTDAYLRADGYGDVTPRLLGSVVNIPLGRDCVDEIYLAYALQPLPRGFVTRALRECKRVLKPGARLVARGLDVGEVLRAARSGEIDGEQLSHRLAMTGGSATRALGWFTEGRTIESLLDCGYDAVRPVKQGGAADPLSTTPGSPTLPHDWVVEARKPLTSRKSITISGWGHLSSMYLVNRELLAAFVRRGFDASYQVAASSEGYLDMTEDDPILAQLARKRPNGDVWVNSVGRYPSEPRDLVVSVLPCDATRMNGGVIAGMNHKSHFAITYSNLSREILRDSGLDVPVHVLPLGVDMSIFNPDGPAYDFGFPEGTFVFFICSHFQPRKGLDILLPAFIEEFSHGEEVALVVKESDAVPGTGERLEEMIDRARATTPRAPRVELIVDASPLEDLAAMQRAADCFVWASRIEGFGLPPLEALACGTPVIAPAYGGHMDYLDDSVALLYPILGMERVAKEYRQFYLFDPAGPWARPDPQGLRAAMRRAFEDRDHLAQLAAAGVARARDYEWSAVGHRWVDLIEANMP